MEIKEQKKILENNLEIINNLWRSLWHTKQRKTNSNSGEKNRRNRFLE